MEAITFLIGFALRLAAPIALTALVAWWLKRLDARWQQEAEQSRILPLRRALATPCWGQRGCAPERRAQCPAFAKQHIPCWQVFRETSGQLQPQCLDCAVFRTAPVPA